VLSTECRVTATATTTAEFTAGEEVQGKLAQPLRQRMNRQGRQEGQEDDNGGVITGRGEEGDGRGCAQLGRNDGQSWFAQRMRMAIIRVVGSAVIFGPPVPAGSSARHPV
jgi:hypothetical protein